VLRRAGLCLVLAGSMAGSATFSGAPVPAKAAAWKVQVKQPEMLRQIARYQRITWRWQRVMNVQVTKSSASARKIQSTEYRRWARDVWRRRAIHVRRLAEHPPHRTAWLCLHRYERHPRQGWRTRTGNGFYGGLQMDRRFMATYGARLLRTKGTADRWSPLEQMWVAERALGDGRGFAPWPNSGRACGLI
jgi:hypothetical protein